MKYVLALICSLLLATTARAENPRCIAEFEAESARIQREAMARAPAPGSDQETQRQFMAPIHAALEAAGAKARACEEASRPRPGSPAAQAAVARERQCTDTANREIDQIKLPPKPSFEQQRAYREAETRILDARMDCLRRAR
ncbi:hypothetical protein [Curvibacter sp. PAE-UM]|uniref:hypothetical protein n=1 Tax=Curvibacter sp. PAE-UM TaxID=1714344 RepID=UPI00070A8533|nr:hypothetical protein [Curvibacter sp. PAE-UM]KRI01434.1 hypothetical protein AO057_08320 [Curvibacter sp. PAE-UM]